MSITVMSLGTAHSNKTLNGASLTYAAGFIAAAGDWIIACSASDLTPTTWTFYDASRSMLFRLHQVAVVANAGNVVSGIYIGRLPFYSESTDEVIVGAGSGQSAAIAVYRVLGLGGNVAIGDHTAGTTHAYMNSVRRVGALFLAFAPCTVTSVDVKLHKFENPTGTLYVRLRAFSDDSIIGTLGEKDVSTLTTTPTFYTFNASSVVNPTLQPVYLSVEYANGGPGNYPIVTYETTSTENYSAGLATHNGSTWLNSAPSAMVWQNFIGAEIVYPLDKTASSTGNGTSASSGATADLSQAEELGIGVIGCEDVPSDVADTVLSGSFYISGNEQTMGTTGGGDASNITILTAAEVLSATTGQYVTCTGNTGSDWAALAATFKARINSLVPVRPSPTYLRM